MNQQLQKLESFRRSASTSCSPVIDVENAFAGARGVKGRTLTDRIEMTLDFQVIASELWWSSIRLISTRTEMRQTSLIWMGPVRIGVLVI